MYNHIGDEEHPNFSEISSEEYWTMSESLIQQGPVGEEGVICKVKEMVHN